MRRGLKAETSRLARTPSSLRLAMSMAMQATGPSKMG